MKNRIKNFSPSLTISYPFLTSLFPPLLPFLLFLLIFCATEVATAQIPTYVPANGLVAYWPFDGNANDISGNGNNGTVNGATLSTDRNGNLNSCYSFNGGGNYINVPYSTTLGIQQSFSSSVWINMNGGSCNPRVYEIHENLNCGGYSLAFNGSGGGSRTFHTANFGNCSTGIALTGGNNPVPTNSWHHVAVVIDGANGLGKLYVDGIMVYQTNGAIIPSINYYGASLCIGNIAPNRCDWWGGLIDDFSLYNRVLTQAEITQIYSSQTSTVQAPCPTLATNLQTGLVGYWPFCGNANDESGNGNNGTVNGATLTTDRFGNANSAYSFDGNDWMDIGVSGVTSGNGESTLAGWYYLDGVPTGVSYIVGYGSTGYLGSVFATGHYGNSGLFATYFGSQFDAISGVNSPTGSWHFITSVKASNGMTKIYLDGNLFYSQTVATPNIGSAIGRIGRAVWESNEFWVGKLDDISIYNRALTTSEIAQLYTDQSTTPLVACTPFLGEDQTVCAGTSVTLSASSDDSNNSLILIDSYSYNVGSAWTHDFSAVPGQAYTVRVTAQFSMGTVCPNFEMDPAYWIPPYNGGVALTHSCNQAWFIQNYCDGSLGMRPTPDVYNPVHTYDYPIVANSNIVTVGFSDCCFGDNCGSISYEFYQSMPSSAYLWSTGATTATINVTPTTTTTYTCTVTDANGNVCTDSVTVFVPQIEATDLTICAGETTTLSVSGINSTATPSACPTLPSNLQTGLVGYWPFCGNANDESGNGNNGSVNGATLTTDRFGNANSAYYFNGSSSMVSCGYNSAFNLTGNQTISYWYKAEPNPNNAFSSILSKDNGGGPQNKYIFGLGYNGVQGDFFMYGPTPQGFLEIHPANQVNSEWNFITWVFSPSEVKLYRNGIYVQSFSMAYSVPFISEQLVIGASENSFFWKGEIDDVAFWNRQLSSSEILVMNNSMYSWSNGATTPTINVSPTSTTTYTCTITSNGVSCTDSVTVVVSNPVIDLGADVTVCGTSTTLTAPAGYDSYLWSNGGTTNTTTVTSNGTYSCTVTQGGCSGTDAVDVTLVNATVSASDSTICAGQSVTLSGPQGGSTSTVCSALPTNLQTGLVGYWPFCGNANDASGNGNNGTVNGATLTSDRFGMASSAYDFNGSSSFINVPSASQLLLTDNTFTISAWGTHAGINNLDKNIVVKSNGIQGQPKWMFWYKATINSPSGLGFASNQQMMGGSQNNIVLNAWNHYLVKKTSDSLLFYINGILTSSTAVQFNNPNTAADLRFGGQEINGGAQWWWGKLDDIAIYNRSLNNTEIQQLYNLNSTTYLWSNGATTPTINVSPTSTTTYTCTITSNGFSCTDSVTVVVSNPVIDLGADVTVCGNSTTLTAPIGYDSYLWSNGGTTNTTIVSANGTYSCTVTQGGCSVTDDVDVALVNATITASDSTICAGETVSISSTQGDQSSNMLYRIRQISTNTHAPRTSTIKLFDNGVEIPSNNYSVTSNFTCVNCGVISEPYPFGNSNNCSDQGWILTNNGIIQFQLNTPNQITSLKFYTVWSGCCRDALWAWEYFNGTDWVTLDNINYNATGCGEYSYWTTPAFVTALAYSWSNGATTSTINVSPTSTTTYTCTITANGVSCTDSVTVAVNNPAIDLGADVTVCGTSTTLTAPSGYDSYLWSNGGTTNTTTVTTNGTYSCTVTQGGCSATDSINVTLIDATITASDSIICAGETTTLSVNVIPSSTFNSVLFPNPVEFNGHIYSKYTGTANWFNAKTICESNGGYLAIPNSVAESDFIQFLSGIDQPATWIGLSDQTAEGIWIDVQGNPVTFFNWYPGEPNNVGDEDFVYIYNQGNAIGGWNDSHPNYLLPFVLETNSIPSQILWSNGATTPTINVSPTSTTTYICTVTTNGVSCTDSVTVAVNNSVIDLGADVTVCGTSTTLTAPSGYESYLWSNGGTTNTTTVSSNGTYSCTVTQGGCSATDAVDVTLVNATISASDSTICAGETVTLSVPQGGATNTACATLPTNLQTGLVGYWPFCGNANDASGNGNNGTVNGATLTTDRFGNANSAYSFDGNDYVSTAVTRGQLTSNFSISFFERYTGSSSAIYSAMIGGSDATGGTQFFIGKNAGNTHLGLEDGNYNGNFTTNGAFFDGQWNHMVIVKIAGVIYLYRNGNLEAQGNFVGCNDSEALIFGNEFEGPGYFWNGQLDDILMFNRSLSTSEIQQLYNLIQTSYSWSNGATTPTINVSPTSTTTYTCTVTTNGVSCTDSVTVAVNNPVIDLGTDVTVCGTSTTLTAPSGYDSYLWSNGGTTNTTTVSANGTYSCTGLLNGCSVTDSIDVVLVSLDAQVNVSSICAGEEIELTATSNLSVNQNSNCIGNTGSPNPWPSPSAYNAGIIDLGNIGAQSVFSISAWVNVGATQNGISILLDASHGGSANWVVQAFGNNTYTWGSLSFTLTPNVWQHVLLTYVNGSKKCFIDGQLVASVYNPISYSGSPQLYLGNWPEGGRRFNGLVDELYITYSELQSSNFVPSQVINVPSANSFGLWHFDEGANATTLNSVNGTAAQIGSWFWASRPVVGIATISWNGVAGASTQTLSPAVTTTYVSSVLINGLTCSDSVTVAVNNPVIDLGADVTVCGTSTTLTAPSGYDSYLWSNGGTTNITTVNASGIYTCTVTQGGCSATDAVDVTLVNATASASDSTICAGETVTLSVPQGGSSSTACAALPTNLQTGLVGYWPFCGNANDASGNGNNGTVNGATLTTDRFGNANSAYGFDGNDGIDCGNSSMLDLTSNYSVAYWYQKNGSDMGAVLSKNNGSGGQNKYVLGVNQYGSNGDFCHWHNGPAPQWRYTGIPIDSQWNFIVWKFNGQTIELYKNGVFVQSFLLDPTFPQISANMIIGNTEGIMFWNGIIDELMMFNRQLSQEEIQQLFTNGQTTYLWSNGATSQTINVSPTSTTTYTCTVTTNGVSCTDSVTVVVNNPTIDLGNDVTVCGTSTTLNAPTGYDSYLWSNDGTTNTTTVTANGTYSCTATQGGCSATDAVDVTLIDATITTSDTTICSGETVTLSVPQGGSTNTACATLPTNLQTGLVGYWPFCGNANDASGNGNNGTVNGATLTADRFGNTNSAYSFGVNSSSLINMSSLPSNSDWSISFWCNPTTSNINSQHFPIGINCQLYWKGIGLSGSGPACGLPTQNVFLFDGSQGCSNWVASNSTYNFNSYNHVGVVKAGTQYKLYKNGVLVNSSTSMDNFLVESLTIGRRCNDPLQYTFDGVIDDIVLLGRGITDAEMQQLYNINSTSYLWSNGSTTPTINVSPTSTTTYTCTVTTNGVSCTDSVTVVVNNPVIDLGADVTVCGTSTTLTASSGYDSYLWSNGGTTNITTVSANGTYTCTVTQGGCNVTDSIDVTLIDATITASDSIICAGESVTLSSNSSGVAGNGCGFVQNATYNSWTLLYGGETVSNVIKGGNNYYIRTNSDVKMANNLSGTYTSLGFASQVNQSPGAQLLGFDNLNRLHVATGWQCLYYLSNNTWTQGGLCGFGTGGQYFANASNGRIVISKGGFLRDIYYSDNNGISWTNATNIDVDWNHITKSSNGNLFASSAIGGTSTKGVIRSVDNGSSWQNINALLQNITGATGISADCSGNLYVVGDRKIFKSEDDGISWQFLANLPTFFNQNPIYGDLLIAPNNTIYYSGYISANSFGLFKSFDFGQTWSQVNEFNSSWSFLEQIDGVVIAMNDNGMYGLSETSNTNVLWSNGATTPTVNVSPTSTTTYTCTVTTNGVSCTDSVTVVVSQPVASITPNGIVEICQGQSIALTANGGVSYLWSTGAPTQSITVNTEAVYTVTVTDANGCTDTESQLVKVNFLPNIGVNNASTCSGQSTTLTATGGLSYVWSPATGLSSTTGTTVTASPSTSTVYTVTGTGANGCTNTATAAVTVNAAPTATITPATATTFCQGGSVVLNANTGTGLSYQWRLNGTNITGATSSSYTANASGSYTVVVTNTSTCSATSTATVVTVNALPTATITASSATTFCQGGSVVLNANTGAGLSYQWRLNGTNITGATSSSYTANASGSYTVVVTNTSTCSATSTATVVTVNALPTATITPATATTFCQGGSVVLNANTGAGLTYQWRLNGTNITGATSSTYTANASGSYTVVVTNTSTCSATSTATVVTVNALPTATITPATTTTFCQGGSVVLNANTGAGLSYQWRLNGNPISGATTSTYTANASGSYTVVVTNTSTCSATSAATVVTVTALPSATITPATATTFCQGGSVVLNANTGAGLTYQWFNNANAISGAISASYTANASGSYTVIVTNTSSCSSTSTATVVTVNALPSATITASSAATFCQGGSVVLTANTGNGLTYQWRLNGTNITGATTSSYTANASGSYTVVVTNTSACSATSTATVVTVNALPTATITPATTTTFCQGGSVVLNANTGTGLSYQWFNNAVAISGTTTSSSYTANASGSYTVVVTNTSTCSATSAATVVTVNALPVASITPNGLVEICQGQSIALTANGGVTYLWSTGAPTQSITVSTEALYTVTVTDINGCTDTESQFVKVNLLPNIGVNNASICLGQSATLTATGGLSYVWSPATGLSATTGSTVSSSTATNTMYTVTGTGANGCTNSATATVTVNALPTATITPATATTFCQGGSVVLNANTDAGLTYQWFNNANAISGAISASYTATTSGSFTVIVTNASTCSATSSAIDVTTIPNIDYYADADGDGYGDVTTLLSTCVQPQGYVTNSSDCNDSNAAIFPGTQEICNDIDDDCNELIDDGLVFTTYYADVDGDSFGDINNPLDECMMPAGYVTNNTDCNDNNANQNTASAEICNGEDDDCDGTIDNGITFLDYYADADGDGFGSGDVISSCSDLGAGYSTNNTDCDDSNSNTNPSATESCNTIDDNCDGQIDEGVQTVYFIDNDGDTYGNPSVSILACTQPVGYTPDDNDCNDTDANINPGAEDIGGNGIDENCDGEIDNSIFELNASISLYPNPTRSELNIQVNSSIIGNDLYIFDAVGKLVFKQQVLSTQTILPVSNFADGNYVVRVGEVVKRFEVIK